jgi:hypothetical protein
VAIGTNPAAGTLSGTVTLSAVAGVATFSGLSINKAGTGYTLTAASPGLTGATSSTITISPAPTKLTFTPSGSTGCSAQNGTLFALNYPGCGGNGATFHSSVNLTDTSGNPVVNNTGAAISVSVTASAGTLTGATGGILTVTIPVGSSTSGSVDFASQGGSWNSNTITAKSTGYTDATATFNK